MVTHAPHNLPMCASFLRRRLQLSLRALLLSIALVCLWLAMYLAPAIRQKEAAERITAAGGSVHYVHQRLPDGWDAREPPGWPAWLRGLVGDDLFKEAESVGFKRATLSVGLTAQLEGLPTLHRLDLNHAQIADADLIHLRNMHSLRVLYFGETATITDAGIVHLANLANLEVLSFGQTSISDDGLVHLKGLTRLRELSFWRSNITDAGLEKISHLKLEVFIPNSQAVTDAGLTHIKNMTTLQSLYLGSSQVTPPALAELRRALPDCRIDD